MGISPQYHDAVSLLSAMDPLQASRLVGDDRDLRAFIESNGLELTEDDIRELKARFRS